MLLVGCESKEVLGKLEIFCRSLMPWEEFDGILGNSPAILFDSNRCLILLSFINTFFTCLGDGVHGALGDAEEAFMALAWANTFPTLELEMTALGTDCWLEGILEDLLIFSELLMLDCDLNDD